MGYVYCDILLVQNEKMCVMKTPAKILRLAIPLLFISASAIAAAPDSTGLPGDHLDLRATLELFKKSRSPEDFEKKLNSKDSKVNNLDLNGDKQVDYIRVYDISKGDAHALVLQAPVNGKESQDVAVIEIEKRGNEQAILQIRGDEALYGENYAVEPKPDAKDSAKQDEGQLRHFGNQQTVVFMNVWYWPCVQYMYYPSYVVWVSPWYWSYYPMWWDPWMPYPFYTYYGWTYMYYDYYYWGPPAYTLTQAHSLYQPRRVVSQTVQQRYAGAQAAHREEVKKNPDQRVNTRTNPQRADNDQRRTPSGTDRPSQRGDVQPAPQPTQQQPRPMPAPQPRPAPQDRPRVQPQPRPAPMPAPRPAPAPAPRPRPR